MFGVGEPPLVCQEAVFTRDRGPRAFLHPFSPYGRAVLRVTQHSQPPERGGPPVKQPRPEEAGSAEGAELGALGRGGTPPKKASVRRLDEDALKRSRLHNNQLHGVPADYARCENQTKNVAEALVKLAVYSMWMDRYELSQDLLDKQVEMLERKYGGVRARTAALTIQRAFRSHCMQKRFLDLANASKGERRLSRRIHALDLLAPDGNTPLRHHGWARGSPTPPSEGSQRRVPPQVPRRTSSIPGGTKESSTWKRPGSEAQRKRQYRVGLNLFNKRPEKGVRYLVDRGFLDACPRAVARFLVSRKGLSKLMIGDYLGNLQCPFNMQVLECFVQELDFAGMQVDLALRKFQSYFILPGEAQKIERLVEVFSHQYAQCNPDVVAKLRSADTLFVLAFSVVLLNTDLHTPSVKADKRMKLDDYVRNLRGVDEGHDLDRDMLAGIYERIKAHPFRPGSDHVSQVLKVQQSIVGKKPNLALAHRRLVCYCRLYEVYDVHKKERPGVHQREVFLFNDLLLVTKIFSKKKNSIQYAFRQSLPLCGMSVALFEAPHYPHGISLSQRVDDRALMTLNARNEHDRCKFVDDLREAILEARPGWEASCGAEAGAGIASGSGEAWAFSRRWTKWKTCALRGSWRSSSPCGAPGTRGTPAWQTWRARGRGPWHSPRASSDPRSPTRCWTSTTSRRRPARCVGAARVPWTVACRSRSSPRRPAR
ncbi:IQ motif and SEC7 domain-containing protein 1 isoform X7 [Ixodes scapularis]|uniref:IQ motif and SEC7 domain-containing protein 1 isoform X7 n=1 Tax=Ixodes scapularis TaxID=6945 RepID=UPI001AD76031|nr:IQ motif and SEC7 domain-containing protein 1 isoform X7 [Ixodes scapularis]